mgnify:CR=1 FL=1
MISVKPVEDRQEEPKEPGKTNAERWQEHYELIREWQKSKEGENA